MHTRAIFLSAFLFILTMSTTGVWATGAKDSPAASTPVAFQKAFRPVIEFGHKGGNLRPYRIGIDASGHVKVLQGRPQLKAESIPAEQVQELLREASDDQFWKMTAADEAEAKKILPDFGSVFVRVRAEDGRRIYHQGHHAGPLGKLFDQLSELVLA